ncbi:MazG family protein [Cryptosporangium arvum]|uniref:MazG family protein n=1 Tax=Cryptosporangium arvum DSM 44712 TaxID=927661 RepID=A0A010YXM6_9ACTN|nr:MazG family protein [Cryptosporangium arvum]EXG79953.1 MazG family protein [Cryptosporangium arvum DSM 44712]
MVVRLIVLVTSPRLPAGLLTADGWDAVRSHPVLAAGPSPLSDAVRAAGVPVAEVGSDPGSALTALRRAAETAPSEAGAAVWLAGANDPLPAVLAERLAADPALDYQVEVLYGSWDPPGARLLDVASVMDRLRSPGGCPWDAEQTHESLRPYLLEEAYEAYDALLDGDLDALREELGDVLLQVAFHARVASEDPDEGFDIDDVAGDLVAKLVRRHPHVFADRAVSGADEVHTNWEAIKKAEKKRDSALDGVAQSQPALSLAAKYLSRARRAGVAVPPPALPPSVTAPATADALGDLLFAFVAAGDEAGLDAEAALRAAARRYAEDVRDAERRDVEARDGRGRSTPS